MSDDWKGEHLIRNSISRQESRANLYGLKSRIAHQNRRTKGDPLPSREWHSTNLLLAGVGGAKKSPPQPTKSANELPEKD